MKEAGSSFSRNGLTHTPPPAQRQGPHSMPRQAMWWSLPQLSPKKQQ